MEVIWWRLLNIFLTSQPPWFIVTVFRDLFNWSTDKSLESRFRFCLFVWIYYFFWGGGCWQTNTILTCVCVSIFFANLCKMVAPGNKVLAFTIGVSESGFNDLSFEVVNQLCVSPYSFQLWHTKETPLYQENLTHWWLKSNRFAKMILCQTRIPFTILQIIRSR